MFWQVANGSTTYELSVITAKCISEILQIKVESLVVAAFILECFNRLRKNTEKPEAKELSLDEKVESVDTYHHTIMISSTKKGRRKEFRINVGLQEEIFDEILGKYILTPLSCMVFLLNETQFCEEQARNQEIIPLAV